MKRSLCGAVELNFELEAFAMRTPFYKSTKQYGCSDALLSAQIPSSEASAAIFDKQSDHSRTSSPTRMRTHCERMRALIAAGFLEYEREQARKRHKGGQGGVLLQGDSPEANGQARDKAGARVGVGGKQVSDAAKPLASPLAKGSETLSLSRSKPNGNPVGFPSWRQQCTN
jgi:osmotically-inducible protein OsmY